MKEKIFVFIIGLLVGAILATGGFYIYQKNNKTEVASDNSSENQTKEFDGRSDMEPPELPEGEMPQKPDGEEPPAKPDDTASETNSITEKTKKNGDSKTKKSENTENTVTTEE